MAKEHHYHTQLTWTGAGEEGTKTYRSYERAYRLSIDGKPDIAGSSDPAFRGDPACHNPEDLLVASTSACHMLWYLHLCAVGGVTVLSYSDTAEGVMSEGADGAGRFERITLRPSIVISADSDAKKAAHLHTEANRKCFIANSLNCPVEHEPVITQVAKSDDT